VVNEVDVHVSQGEIVGLLGPNGAGKTTTFYMMVGLIARTRAGLIDGEDLTAGPDVPAGAAGIGYLAQEPSVFRKLTVEENVLAILQMMGSRAGAAASGWRRCSTSWHQAPAEDEGLRALRRRAPAAGDHAGAGRRAEVHAARRAVRRRRPDRGARHPADRRRSAPPRIGVLISDHNVEQTLDIVDRAYIMYDGRVRVSGTVSELVWNDEVAEIYLGPTLTARMRQRYPTESRMTEFADEDGSVPGNGTLKQEMKINPRLYQAMDLLYMPLLDLQQHLKQELLNNPFLEMAEADAEEQVESRRRRRRKEDDEIDWEEILLNGFEAGGRREEYEQREYYEPVSSPRGTSRPPPRPAHAAAALRARAAARRGDHRQHHDEGYLECPLEEVVAR
jgi:ABC-type multidrug transport system ATPase subunit